MLRRGITVLVVAQLALVACAGGDSQSTDEAPASDEPIRVVGFGPLTGPASWVGLGNRDGFTMAIDEINADGGVNGRQIEFEFLDDEFEVSQAQQVVRRITRQEDPFLVYAGTGSTVFLSVADQLRESGLPVYNGFSGSEGARKTPEVETMFHGEAVSTKWVAPSLVEAVTEDLAAERVAVMHEDGEWGRTLCADVITGIEESDAELVTTQTYAATATDFSGQLVAVRDSDAQVVINCGLFPAAKVILRQANELGVEALFVGDAGQANATVWSDGGAATENWLFNWYEPQFLTDTTGPMGEWTAKYAEKYPDAPEGRPNHADAFSYNAGYLVRDALEAAGDDVTQESFLAAMSEISDVQVTPFSPNVDCANERNECFVDLNWMRVKDGEPASATDADFEELKELIAGY